MEKIYTLLWILVALGVFVWRMIQKARTAMAEELRERPAGTGKAPPLPATSFEELLKQMQTQNRTGNPGTEGSTRLAPAPERQPLRERMAAEGRAVAPQPASSRAPEFLRPASENLSADAGRIRAPRTPSNAPTAGSFVADRLRNPADLRAAFVLGEILQRRF